MAKTPAAAAAAGQRCVTASQGNRISAYGLDEDGQAYEAAGRHRPSAADGEQSREDENAEEEVRLSQKQFARVEFRHQEDGEPHEDALRQPAIRESGD